MSPLLTLYSLALRAVEPALKGLIARRLARGKELPDRADEKRAVIRRKRPTGPLVWCHGASVGECQSALPLIDAVLERYPDTHILMTSVTRTSAALMAERLPARAIHQFMPLDHPGWMDRFLDHWEPDAVIWLESELWPNALMEIERREIPAYLVNARLSETSYKRWSWARGAVREMLAVFDLVFAQSKDDATRVAALGARDPITAGNLKFAAAPLPASETELTELRQRIGDRPVWLAASTHPGEEEQIVETHDFLVERFPDLLTLIVPRHPERGNEICSLLKAHRPALRSAGNPLEPATQIYIADTLGELGLFYRLAPIVFVGGSFVPIGGHNPIEPALLNCAITTGPEIANFMELYTRFWEKDAVMMVANPQVLAERIAAWLTDPAELAKRQLNALAASQSETSVLDRIGEHLWPRLDPFLKSARLTDPILELHDP